MDWEYLAQLCMVMTQSIFERLQTYDYENLIFCQEKELGLQAIIAIHDTTLGPAAGGVRMLPYATEQEAIEDVLRLARGMTYKGAASGVNLGGGKCVIIGDPKRDKSEALFRALGRFIQRLDGLYITGEDVGTNTQDMDIMAMETPHVFSLSSEAEEVSYFTAYGVVQGIQACLQGIYGSSGLSGRTVAVQGIGSVGHHTVERLIEGGALVTVADIDQERIQQIKAAYPSVTVTSPEEIHSLPVDVYCPCALGAIINKRTLPQLRCKIVCGAANNQLADEQCGEEIEHYGILYAPDYIVNAGGMIVYADSHLGTGGFNRQRAMTAVARIYNTTEQTIALARKQEIATFRAADLFAEQRIASVRQARMLMTR